LSLLIFTPGKRFLVSQSGENKITENNFKIFWKMEINYKSISYIFNLNYGKYFQKN